MRSVTLGATIGLALNELGNLALLMRLFNLDFSVKYEVILKMSVLVTWGSKSTKNIDSGFLV